MLYSFRPVQHASLRSSRLGGALGGGLPLRSCLKLIYTSEEIQLIMGFPYEGNLIKECMEMQNIMKNVWTCAR